jgi:hypothetical protein
VAEQCAPGWDALAGPQQSAPARNLVDMSVIMSRNGRADHVYRRRLARGSHQVTPDLAHTQLRGDNLRRQHVCVDPIYMVMLIQILGPAYVVWDKGATIQFKRPGRSTVHACFILDAPEIDAIKAELTDRSAIERNYQADLVDADGVIHASIMKTLHMRRKEATRQ